MLFGGMLDGSYGDSVGGGEGIPRGDGKVVAIESDKPKEFVVVKAVLLGSY
jgi:hypothetical protein